MGYKFSESYDESIPSFRNLFTEWYDSKELPRPMTASELADNICQFLIENWKDDVRFTEEPAEYLSKETFWSAAEAAEELNSRLERYKW